MFTTKSINSSIVAIAVLIAFLCSCEQASFFSKDNDFRISDTAKVSRIEIISQDTVILSRSDAKWLVNNEVKASNIAITNFLFSFMRMSSKDSKDAAEIENISTIRIKIIEGKKKHILRFYESNGASFLIKEGSKRLYSVEVNGFPNIKPYEVINPDPDYWRERTLFNLQASEIKEISLFHPTSPINDFSIKIQDGMIGFFDGEGAQIPQNQTDTEKLNFYLSYFTNVFYDSTSEIPVLQDNVATWILKIESQSGQKYELKIFPLLINGKADMFRALVQVNNEQQYRITRFMALDLLLQDKSHFLKE